MDSSLTILVIILSSFLALFLFFSLLIAYKTIQILNHLKSITDRAEKIIDTAEHVGDVFKHSAGPIALAKFIAGIAEQVFKKDNKKGKS
jgi:hypothetical protein